MCEFLLSVKKLVRGTPHQLSNDEYILETSLVEFLASISIYDFFESAAFFKRE